MGKAVCASVGGRCREWCHKQLLGKNLRPLVALPRAEYMDPDNIPGQLKGASCLFKDYPPGWGEFGKYETKVGFPLQVFGKVKVIYRKLWSSTLYTSPLKSVLGTLEIFSRKTLLEDRRTLETPCVLVWFSLHQQQLPGPYWMEDEGNRWEFIGKACVCVAKANWRGFFFLGDDWSKQSNLVQ